MPTSEQSAYGADAPERDGRWQALPLEDGRAQFRFQVFDTFRDGFVLRDLHGRHDSAFRIALFESSSSKAT